MWKRSDANEDVHSSMANDSGKAAQDRASTGQKTQNGASRVKRAVVKDSAVIGPSITVKGDISGHEDVHVLGSVEGSIKLDSHNLIVGSSGDVSADITAREIDVEGVIVGDITGHEKIVIRETGRVRGNIRAPKVVLEEGSQFKGAVEMDVESRPTSTASSDNVTPLSEPEAKKASGN